MATCWSHTQTGFPMRLDVGLMDPGPGEGRDQGFSCLWELFEVEVGLEEAVTGQRSGLGGPTQLLVEISSCWPAAAPTTILLCKVPGSRRRQSCRAAIR